MNLKKVAVLVLGLGVAFNSFSTELVCKANFKGEEVIYIALINKDQRQITLGSGENFFECVIYGVTHTTYYSGCPNELNPKSPEKALQQLTLNRHTLDLEFDLETRLNLNFKCELSEAKI